MARKMEIASGKIGKVIFYNRMGKQCARSAPVTIRQTEGMKKRAANFSLASTISTAIRNYMPVICNLRDGTRHSRLTGAFSSWLKTSSLDSLENGPIPGLNLFNLNPSKILSSKWEDQLEVTRHNNRLSINISSFDALQMMAVPKDSATCRLNLSSIAIPLREGQPVAVNNNITIDINEPAFNGASFLHELPIVPGSVILTAFSVECLDKYNTGVKIRKGYYLPAGFVYTEWLGMNARV